MIGQARRKLLFAALGALSIGGLGAASALGDLQIAGYQDRLHDLYYVGNDRAFIGDGYIWSGYGRLADPIGTSANWKHVTMISDNYFITADHNRPKLRDDPSGALPKVRFYRTSDPNGEYWESELAVSGDEYLGQGIESTDLWVGKLANTPPAWVLRYPLAKRHESTNYLSYTSDKIFVFGQDSPRSFSSVRVGRNEIDVVFPQGNYSWDFNPLAGLGPDEAQTVGGDSGAPSFFVSGQMPVLAGIHTGTNYDSGVSGKLPQIMAAVGEPISVSTGLEGDVNGDFRVSIGDLAVLANFYGTSGPARYYQGDLSGDGKVNFNDFKIIAGNLGRSLYAPADFNRDGTVNAVDLSVIGDNWLRTVDRPFTMGDANGDSIVNFADIQVFDDNQYRGYFGKLPAPLSPIVGDLTADGIVGTADLRIVTTNYNTIVSPGTNGDVDGNGVVNNDDLLFIALRVGDSFGDIDGDHLVGSTDFAILASNWQKSVAGGRLSGDMNGDGRVDAFDAAVLFGWWDVQSGGTFPNITAPEPGAASLLLAAAGLASCFVRSRWR